MSATTQTMKISEVRSELDSLIERVYDGETRIIVEKSGIPVAMIVSPEDWRRFEEFERDQQDPFAILDEMGAAFKDVPLEEIEREAAKALAEVRAETRREEAFEAMRQISQAFADVPVEELERQVELALLEARAEMRAERARATAINE